MLKITMRNTRIESIYTSDLKGKRDFNRFVQVNFEFWASASAALINSGAAVQTSCGGDKAVLTVSKVGLIYEANIGSQILTMCFITKRVYNYIFTVNELKLEELPKEHKQSWF